MKEFNFEINLKCYCKEAVASLYWCKNQMVFVNDNDIEIDWLSKSKEGKWKPLWKVLSYYPYTTRTFVNHKKDTTEFNFSIGGIGEDDTSALARLIYDVWFGEVDRKYHKSDNKTALKIENRLTGKIVYLGWYDGRFTVTERPAEQDPDFPGKIININED